MRPNLWNTIFKKKALCFNIDKLKPSIKSRFEVIKYQNQNTFSYVFNVGTITSLFFSTKNG